MPYEEAALPQGANQAQGTDVGQLVIGAADGDGRAWDLLITGFSDLVSSIAFAHRLSDADSAVIGARVWRRLGDKLGKIRQPDRVGAWVAAVARDECVKVLTLEETAA